MQEDEEILCRAATTRATEAVARAYTAITDATTRCFELSQDYESVRHSINRSYLVRADARRTIAAAERIIGRAWSIGSPPRDREDAPI